MALPKTHGQPLKMLGNEPQRHSGQASHESPVLRCAGPGTGELAEGTVTVDWVVCLSNFIPVL